MSSDHHETVTPSLDSQFSHDDISMELTRCGLLVDNAEQLARLYSDHRDWAVVEQEWIENRVDQRSTKTSSKGIYRALSGRFNTISGALPRITRLPSVFDQCETTRDKAQILYFYLLENDPLVRYVVHQYVQRAQRQGVNRLDFSQETISGILNDFHYADGDEFDYASSTTQRWGEGFRAVMRKIGVLETKQSFTGQRPSMNTTPLLVASGYSWEQYGDDWLEQPIGWLYLFQSEPYWDSLAERLSDHSAWDASSLHTSLRLTPTEETYSWAESATEQ